MTHWHTWSSMYRIGWKNMNNLQAHTICIQDMNTFNYNLYDFIKKCTKNWNAIIFDPKKKTFPRLSSSVKASPRCRKSDALSMQRGHVYIYIYAWWYDWWSLCTYYNFIDMIDDACVLLHLMKNDVRTVCIGYYKTIQHCKTISKSVEILQCSISYYYILYKNMLHGSMTQKLRKKHGEKKKTSTVSPCPTSCLIFSSFETSTPVLLLSSVTSISAAFPR